MRGHWIYQPVTLTDGVEVEVPCDGLRWTVDAHVNGAATLTVASTTGAQLGTASPVAAGGVNVNGWTASKSLRIKVTGADGWARVGVLV